MALESNNPISLANINLLKMVLTLSKAKDVKNYFNTARVIMISG